MLSTIDFCSMFKTLLFITGGLGGGGGTTMPDCPFSLDYPATCELEAPADVLPSCAYCTLDSLGLNFSNSVGHNIAIIFFHTGAPWGNVVVQSIPYLPKSMRITAYKLSYLLIPLVIINTLILTRALISSSRASSVSI